MKALLGTCVIVLTFLATPSFVSTASDLPTDSVKIISTRSYLFHFKVEKKLIGGVVEVYDDFKKLVASEKILKSRHILDFFYLRPGHYTIKIVKGDEEFVFEYQNKD